jgi:hypothetical protein
MFLLRTCCESFSRIPGIQILANISWLNPYTSAVVSIPLNPNAFAIFLNTGIFSDSSPVRSFSFVSPLFVSSVSDGQS